MRLRSSAITFTAELNLTEPTGKSILFLTAQARWAKAKEKEKKEKG